MANFVIDRMKCANVYLFRSSQTESREKIEQKMYAITSFVQQKSYMSQSKQQKKRKKKHEKLVRMVFFVAVTVTGTVAAVWPRMLLQQLRRC